VPEDGEKSVWKKQLARLASLRCVAKRFERNNLPFLLEVLEANHFASRESDQN
jgi:hypothetical protein